jgi:hypothetical protein
MRKACLLGLSFFLATAVLQGLNHQSALAASAASYLATVMDQYHRTVDVYTDCHAAGNHFVAKCAMYEGCPESALPPMKECCASKNDDCPNNCTTPKEGCTSIECKFLGRGADWGGWYFQIGCLNGSEKAPSCSWDSSCQDCCGRIDLRGATELTFYAKGAKGGEKVEFFCFGVRL